MYITMLQSWGTERSGGQDSREGRGRKAYIHGRDPEESKDACAHSGEVCRIIGTKEWGGENSIDNEANHQQEPGGDDRAEATQDATLEEGEREGGDWVTGGGEWVRDGETDQDHFNLWRFAKKELSNESHSKVIDPTDGIRTIELANEDRTGNGEKDFDPSAADYFIGQGADLFFVMLPWLQRSRESSKTKKAFNNEEDIDDCIQIKRNCRGSLLKMSISQSED
jgi:hypothetical protein